MPHKSKWGCVVAAPIAAMSALAPSASARVAALHTVAATPIAAPFAARFAWRLAHLTTTKQYLSAATIGATAAFAYKRLAAASFVLMASPTRT